MNAPVRSSDSLPAADSQDVPQVMTAQSTLREQDAARSEAVRSESGAVGGGVQQRAGPLMNGAAGPAHSERRETSPLVVGPRTAQQSVPVNSDVFLERGRCGEAMYGAVQNVSSAGHQEDSHDGSASSHQREDQGPIESQLGEPRIRAGANDDGQATRGTAGPATPQELRGPEAPGDEPHFEAGAETVEPREQGSAGFLTPRSMRTAWAEYNLGVEAAARPGFGGSQDWEAWPRWMNRLTGLFRPPNIPRTWMPSPLPSPALDSAHDVGRARAAPRHQSPGGEALHRGEQPRAATPPSSSSLPAEAIQAEVQRQLGGLLEKLQRTEAENVRLQRQLAEVQREEPKDSVVDSRPSLRQRAEPLLPPQPPAGDLRPKVTSTARSDFRSDVLGGLWEEISGRLGVAREHAATGGQGGRGVPGNDEHQGGGKALNEGEVRQVQRSDLQGPPLQQPGPMPSSSSTTPPSLLDAIAKGIQQLQELQVQSLRKEEDGSPEQIKTTVTNLPTLRAPSDDQAGVQLQDWLALVSTCMQDLSMSSGKWWEEVMSEVAKAYMVWLAATPLERLQVKPSGESKLTTGKWTRLNARSCTMVLGALDEVVKEDLVSRRATNSIVAMLFRLHTVYQPGGPHERARVLQALQDPPAPETLSQALTSLRAWPRSMQRCKDMGMACPDGSVLAKALTTIAGKFVNTNADAAFRTQVLRSSLRIDGQPTLENVQSYHQHLQAEVENLMATMGTSSPTSPKLRPMRPTSGATTTEPSSPNKSAGQCRYFFKASGCRRGAKCPYSHDMSSISKAEKSKKCLTCGAEDHRQRDCPTSRPQRPPRPTLEHGPKPTTPSSSTTTPTPQVQQVAVEEQGAEASTVQGDPVWTMEALLRAAAQVVKSTENTPEPKAPSMKVMKLERPGTFRGNEADDVEDVYALMDSGATHPLRRAWTEEEWLAASPVVVTLAGGESVSLRMNSGGTLLVPASGGPGGGPTSPIVPLGSLVQQLGYTLEWSNKKCKLMGRGGDVHHLRVRNGCPEITECQALNLIARLEEKNLDTLQANTEATRVKIRQAALSLEKTWFDHLIQYCRGERASDAHQAIDEAPFFQEVPLLSKQGLCDGFPEGNGWQALRGLHHLNRRARKRLHESNKWVVHLFAGKKAKEEFKYLEKHGYVVLELDIERGATHDVLTKRCGEHWSGSAKGQDQGSDRRATLSDLFHASLQPARPPSSEDQSIPLWRLGWTTG